MEEVKAKKRRGRSREIREVRKKRRELVRNKGMIE